MAEWWGDYPAPEPEPERTFIEECKWQWYLMTYPEQRSVVFVAIMIVLVIAFVGYLGLTP